MEFDIWLEDQWGFFTDGGSDLPATYDRGTCRRRNLSSVVSSPNTYPEAFLALMPLCNDAPYERHNTDLTRGSL